MAEPRFVEEKEAEAEEEELHLQPVSELWWPSALAIPAKMNRDRRIMDESRINSIIYRIGACLIVSSLFMSAVNATAKPISEYRFTS